MSYNYNQATLVGRLTKSPEQKVLSETSLKTSFTLAVSRPYKREDGSVDTDFIPVCFWGKNAEISYQILKKGSPVLISGKIQVRTYEKDDDRHWITEIIGESFQILEPKQKAEDGLEPDLVKDKKD